MVSPSTALDTDDHRVYIHPITKETFTSVTTILGETIAKPRLPAWYARHASIRALELLPKLATAARHPLCGRDSHCGRCVECLRRAIAHAPTQARDIAADRGTRVHHIAEWYALTGTWLTPDPDITTHAAHLRDLATTHQISFHAAEVTVLNRAHGWAGTLDAVLTCGWMPPKHADLVDIPLYTDYKTGGVWEQAAYQLAAYRHAEAVLLPDGTELPTPGAHTTTGLSIQITGDGWWIRPCQVDDDAYRRFLRVLDLHRDLYTTDRSIIGRAMYKPRRKATECPSSTSSAASPASEPSASATASPPKASTDAATPEPAPTN